MHTASEQLPADTAVAVESLYAAHSAALQRYLYTLVSDHHLAEELCHDSFYKALRAWDSRRPGCDNRAWLYQIATNTAYDALRRRRRIRFSDIDGAGPQALATADRRLEQIDRRETIRAALDQLSPSDQHVLWASSAGATLDELAGAIGCPTNTVKSRLHRARARFRAAYQG